MIIETTKPTYFDPASISYDDAAAFLPREVSNRESYDHSILDLIENNDFWQDSRRYVGPLPAPGAGFLAGMQALKKSFAPISKLREVLRRHVRGVVGREPQFEIVIDGAKQLAKEADSVQGAIWDSRGEHTIIEQFTRRLRATGTAYLRFDIPPGLLKEGLDRNNGEQILGVAAKDWQDAYKMFYLELAPRDTAYIHTDRATMRQTAFYSYEEPLPNLQDKTRKCVQLSWLDDDALTQVRVVRDDGSSDNWSLDTGGRLLLIEATMEPLLAPDLLKLQDIVSSIATMIKVNGDVAGFPEKTAIDLEAPSEIVPDPENPGEFVRKPVAVTAGARSMQFLYSYQDVDEHGRPAVDMNGNPTIRRGLLQYRAPVSSQPLRDDADWFEKQIYLAVNQEHIMARRSAAVSAEALVEMRADYADSLLETKPHVEKAMREVLHARLCAAAYLANENKTLKQFKEARVRVDAQMNAGPLSTAERNEVLVRYEKGLVSRETAMVLLGTEDVDAELAKIKAEQAEEYGDGMAAPVSKEDENEA